MSAGDFENGAFDKKLNIILKVKGPKNGITKSYKANKLSRNFKEFSSGSRLLNDD